jgi:hypothetical protein
MPPENSLPFRVQGAARGCARVVALKYLDTGNVSFSTTAAKQRDDACEPLEILEHGANQSAG